MTFTLSLLLIPYAVIALIFLIFALLNVYHLVYYGATTRISFIFTAVFIVGAMLTFLTTWWFTKDIAWSQEVTVQLFNGAAPTL